MTVAKIQTIFLIRPFGQKLFAHLANIYSSVWPIFAPPNCTRVIRFSSRTGIDISIHVNFVYLVQPCAADCFPARDCGPSVSMVITWQDNAFYFMNLNALSRHFFFCSRFGCTYRFSVVPMFEWPSSTLTVL